MKLTGCLIVSESGLLINHAYFLWHFLGTAVLQLLGFVIVRGCFQQPAVLNLNDLCVERERKRGRERGVGTGGEGGKWGRE